MSLHPVVAAAGEGTLPSWSQAGPRRAEHMLRVADLLADWALAWGLGEEAVVRWRAAGLLHDALKEADPEEIRGWLPSELGDLPSDTVHGPAAAECLRGEGVSDEPFLRAVSFHTIGHPELDQLGRALYVADYLEPGRRGREEWSAALRSRMPEESGFVVREVARIRIKRLLEIDAPIRPETSEFWNVLISELDG